jgi:hypothetical protein
MCNAPAHIVDPDPVRAWRNQPSDTDPDTSRAEQLGLDDHPTAPGIRDVLDIVDDVLAGERGWCRLIDQHGSRHSRSGDGRDGPDRDVFSRPAALRTTPHQPSGPTGLPAGGNR